VKNKPIPRRTFINKTSATLAASTLMVGMASSARAVSKPAILGGPPACTTKWPEWPMWNSAQDERSLLKVMRSGVWSRNKVVKQFEKKYAELLGAKRCLATTNGTHALIVSLAMLGIGAGDEVLTTPYTFIATIDSILQNNAMPIFVDVDPETFQIDPDKLEEKITPNTKAILPVHILGLPCDMDKIMAIAKKHNLIVIEDACQAWMAEYDNKKIGTIGNAGCFSFQTSKNLPIDEGGAIISNDERFMDKALSYHNFGRAVGSMVTDVSGGYMMVATKCRMTEYQAAIGLAQMERLEDQTQTRNENADYLRNSIKDIPGILPYRLYDKVTRAAYHLFPFRYQKEQFKGMPRSTFLKALKAEGVPCSGGYVPINNMPYLKDALSSRVFQAVYPKDKLDFEKYVTENRCPQNDQLCEEAVWLFQSMLLRTKKDMDAIAAAINKVWQNAEVIQKNT
jgi:perosamine synthetase